MRHLALLGLIAVAACDDGDDDNPDLPDLGWDARDYALNFQILRDDDPLGMFMSAWGTDDDDIWLVGGQKNGGAGFVLRGGRDDLVPLTLPEGTPMLNWVHGTAPDDVWVGGVGGSLLRWDGRGWQDLSPEEPIGGAIWGLHAAAPDDVLIVGGFFFASGAPFAWHYDGTSVEPITLPDGIPPTGTLFKTFHDGEQFVVVGGRGLTMTVKGRVATLIDTGIVDDMVTVHKAPGRPPVAVGGLSAGALWSFEREVWTKQADVVRKLNGVHDVGNGIVVAVGDNGYAGVWNSEDAAWSEAEPTTLQLLHGVWVAPNGDTWGVGGNFLTSQPQFVGTVLFSPGPTK